MSQKKCKIPTNVWVRENKEFFPRYLENIISQTKQHPRPNKISYEMSQSWEEPVFEHHVIFSSRRSLNFDKLQIDATRSIKEFGHPSPGVVQLVVQRHKKRNDKPSTYATLIAMSSRRVPFSQKLASALASLFISL